MVEGVASGVIDVIVSSHEPQGADTKRQPFARRGLRQRGAGDPAARRARACIMTAMPAFSHVLKA